MFCKPKHSLYYLKTSLCSTSIYVKKTEHMYLERSPWEGFCSIDRGCSIDRVITVLSCRQSCSNIQYYGRISFNFLDFLVILARTDALASCLPIDATVVFFEGQNKGPAAICVRESAGVRSCSKTSRRQAQLRHVSLKEAVTAFGLGVRKCHISTINLLLSFIWLVHPLAPYMYGT